MIASADTRSAKTAENAGFFREFAEVAVFLHSIT